jgi:hypothetical protein
VLILKAVSASESKGNFLNWLTQCWKLLESDITSRYEIGDPTKQNLCQDLTGHGVAVELFTDLQNRGKEIASSQNVLDLGYALLGTDCLDENQDDRRFLPFTELVSTTMVGRHLFLGSLGRHDFKHHDQ